MSELETLIAKENIKTQLCLYCKGIDRRDWSLVRSCFGEGHHHKHGPFEGTLDEFVGFASENMKHVSVSHHSLANFIITVADNGVSARSEVNFTAVHLIKASVTADLGYTIKGKDTDWSVAGRYVDDWVLEKGQWLIIKRQAYQDWQRIEPAMGRPGS